MATVPVPHTFTAGDNATSSVMQTLTDSNLYALGSITSATARRPLCVLTQTVAQSIASGTYTAITFDSETADYDNGHSTTTNPDRYTANTAGWYEVSGVVTFAANATGGRRSGRVSVNGTPVNGSLVSIGPSSGLVGVPVNQLVFLNANDILRLEGFQDSGGSLNTSIGAPIMPSLSLQWVSN